MLIRQRNIIYFNGYNYFDGKSVQINCLNVMVGAAGYKLSDYGTSLQVNDGVELKFVANGLEYGWRYL